MLDGWCRISSINRSKNIFHHIINHLAIFSTALMRSVTGCIFVGSGPGDLKADRNTRPYNHG